MYKPNAKYKNTKIQTNLIVKKQFLFLYLFVFQVPKLAREEKITYIIE